MDGVYSGESIQGLRHGVGTLRWSNGDEYIGEFKRGFRSGAGSLTERDRKYEGEWKVRYSSDGHGMTRP